MNIKKLILSCMLMLGFISASAQEPNEKTEYLFNPHWYIQLQGGGQYTLGESSFGDLFSPNVQAALGYQFDDVLGVRLSVNAWQSKGASEYEAINKTFTWKWKYVAPTIDLTANLSNLFCGYNPDRFFNLSLFAGVGANFGFSNDEAYDAQQAIAAIHQPLVVNGQTHNTPLSLYWDGSAARLVAKAGLVADFRLSDQLSLGLEVNANTLNDHYNSKPANNPDWYFNGLVGLKINLGKTKKAWEPGMEHYHGLFNRTQVVERVVENVVEVEKIVEKPVYIDKIIEVEKKPEPMRRDVFFTINSSRIDPSETVKLDEIAAYLRLNPDAKVTITGYADKGTGNARINERLGKNRAKVVTDRLVRDYRIDRSRIITDSKGDTEQPFAENDKNRVSICIAE